MTSTSTEELRCTVEGEDKLPGNIGAETICSAIRRAAAPALRSAALSPADVSVSVQVTSQHTLTGAATVGGTKLPENHVATMDRPLTERAVGMLADGIAAELSKLAPQ